MEKISFLKKYIFTQGLDKKCVFVFFANIISYLLPPT